MTVFVEDGCETKSPDGNFDQSVLLFSSLQERTDLPRFSPWLSFSMRSPAPFL
jgi:hypothetical protein